MIFRQIPNSKYYEAAKEGYIRRIGGNVLKGYSNKKRNGYVSVNLSEDNVQKTWTIHQLIALTYPEICGEYFEGAEIDHINTITTDNRAENLHWVKSRKENMNNPLTKENCKKAYTEEHREITRKRMLENNPTKQEGFWTEERRKACSERQKGKKHKAESIELMKERAKGRYLGGKSSKAQAVICIKPNGEEQYFDAYRTAERTTGISHSTIKRLITNNKPDKYGNIWKLY